MVAEKTVQNVERRKKIENNMTEIRSITEKKKLEIRRLKLLKDIQKVDKNWTTIWIITIFVYIMLSIIFAFSGWNNAAWGMILAVILSIAFFNNHRLDVKDQMSKIKEMKRLKDQIIEKIKKQKVLEKKIAKIKYPNE